MADKIIVLAGGTGDLGSRIARELAPKAGTLRVIIRPGTDAKTRQPLEALGAELVEVDYSNAIALTKACGGADCVVSALSGLEPVILTAQKQLLDAAVAAAVPRFIPSDYSIDYHAIPKGRNRNFDLRRQFAEIVDKAPIRATSIFNGAFADMLTGQAPVIQFKQHRVMYWQNADQKMDFTTKNNTAAYTAQAALDDNTPRALHIAGDQVTARELAAIMSDVEGVPFALKRAGGLAMLSTMIAVMRTVYPQKGEVFPIWQGMQYLRDMFSGDGQKQVLDNARYPGITWTSARDVLAAHKDAAKAN